MTRWQTQWLHWLCAAVALALATLPGCRRDRAQPSGASTAAPHHAEIDTPRDAIGESMALIGAHIRAAREEVDGIVAARAERCIEIYNTMIDSASRAAEARIRSPDEMPRAEEEGRDQHTEPIRAQIERLRRDDPCARQQIARRAIDAIEGLVDAIDALDQASRSRDRDIARLNVVGQHTQLVRAATALRDAAGPHPTAFWVGEAP